MTTYTIRPTNAQDLPGLMVWIPPPGGIILCRVP